MKNIPTAEEFINSEEFEPDAGICFEDYHGDVSLAVPSMMIEFAKLHVQAALEAVKENVALEDWYGVITNHSKFDENRDYWIQKDSILNAYFLENIK